MNESCNP
jgi:hypothetical protein